LRKGLQQVDATALSFLGDSEDRHNPRSRTLASAGRGVASEKGYS